MSSKALLPSTIFLLILMVIVLVGGFLTVKVYGEKVQQLLNQLIRETPESLVLKEAVKCSHMRCFDGCDRVKNIDWEYLDNLECPCESSDLNKDGKVCDDEARVNPINVVSAEPGQIYKRRIIDVVKPSKQPVHFVADSEDNCKERGVPNVVTIDKDIILAKVDDQQCNALRGHGVNIGNCFDQVVVEAGAYYLWTTDLFLGLGADTVICSQKPEQSQLDCENFDGVCRIENCLQGETQIKGYCPIVPDPRGTRDETRVCCKSP